MSVAGGIENAFHAGAQVGCDCLQIFVKNQRQWQAKPLTKEQIDAYQAAQRETGLAPVIAHASYLLNLASPDQSSRRKSVLAMVDELERCEALAVSGLVFHPGAHMDSSEKEGIQRVVESLHEAIGATSGFATRILIETTAGQGTSLGYRFEQIGDMLDGVRRDDRLGVCLDTCHLFAAGYDFREQSQYDSMVDEMDRVIDLSNIYCIHVNDSKRELGSRVDRHDHIGKGKIGKEAFAHFMNDNRFARMPMILETPKGKNGRRADFDKVNLGRLRSLMRR